MQECGTAVQGAFLKGLHNNGCMAKAGGAVLLAPGPACRHCRHCGLRQPRLGGAPIDESRASRPTLPFAAHPGAPAKSEKGQPRAKGRNLARRTARRPVKLPVRYGMAHPLPGSAWATAEIKAGELEQPEYAINLPPSFLPGLAEKKQTLNRFNTSRLA